jgi:hypothetical protein
MFRWMRALLTMMILMAAAYLIAQIVGGLYDKYNHYGILTVIGLSVFAVSVLGFAEGMFENWRRSRQKRDR